MNGAVEESLRRRIAPIVELWPKIKLGQMPTHASHDSVAIAPWRTKVESKRVVFDVGPACIILDRTLQLESYPI
jgi:hypothetical protein